MRECQAHVCTPHRRNTHASYLSKLTVILINLQVPFDTLMYESRLTVRVFGSIRGQCIWPERQRAGAATVAVVRPGHGEGWRGSVRATCVPTAYPPSLNCIGRELSHSREAFSKQPPPLPPPTIR